MYSPRNQTSWDKYMLKDISKYKFYGRSQLIRLRGKYTVQSTHCAMYWVHIVGTHWGADWVQIGLWVHIGGRAPSSPVGAANDTDHHPLGCSNCAQACKNMIKVTKIAFHDV